MAAAATSCNKERHIVHVKDIFGGEKNKSVDVAAAGSSKRSGSPPPLRPGVHTTDSNHNNPIKQSQNKRNDPRVIAGSTGNVIFGNRDALLKDVKKKNESISRKKREAPRAPVLVDIDVGFEEQQTGEVPCNDKFISESKNDKRSDLPAVRQSSPSTRSLSPPVRPAPPKVPAQMDRSKQASHFSSLSSNQSNNVSIQSNGHHKQRDSTKSAQKSVVKQNEHTFMSSLNNISNARGLNSNSKSAVFKNGRSQSLENGLDNSNSSSSGIGSSISDSSSETPEHFRTRVVLGAYKDSSRAVIKKASEESEDDLDDDSEDSDFFEDEMTLDFGEEEQEQVEARRMKLYQEYHGEDFAKYLNDDEDTPAAAKPKKRQKKRKDKKKQKSQDATEEKYVAPTISPSGTTKSNNNADGKRSLKVKLGQIFTLPGSEGKKSARLGTGGIQAFTYADSKMGTTRTEKDIDDIYKSSRSTRKTSAPSSLISDDVPPNSDETNERFSSKRWWTKETLSAKTLDSNSDIMLKAKRDDVDISSSYSADSINPAIQNGVNNYPSDDEQLNDFESYRKNNFLYNSKGKSQGPKPNTSLWRKISRSFKKEDQYDDVYDNTTQNPLSLAMAGQEVTL